MEFIWLSRWQPQLLAILRIVTALLFLEHGLMKLIGFPAPPPGGGIAGALPPLMLTGAVIETVGGILIALGLFTRLAAFIAAGEMAVAYWMFHAPQSPWPAINNGDAAILYCFIFLYLAAAGPGAWSVDGARVRGRMEGFERV